MPYWRIRCWVGIGKARTKGRTLAIALSIFACYNLRASEERRSQLQITKDVSENSVNRPNLHRDWCVLLSQDRGNMS